MFINALQTRLLYCMLCCTYRPGPLRGPVRGPKDSRAAPLSTARRLSMFFHENWQKNRAEPARPPAGARTGPLGCHHGPSTGFLRPNGQMKRPGESGAASSAPRRPYGWWKMSRCPWEPWGSRPGTVRNWPKCLFLLAVRAPEWICDLGLNGAVKVENLYMYLVPKKSPVDNLILNPWSSITLENHTYVCVSKVTPKSRVSLDKVWQ